MLHPSAVTLNAADGGRLKTGQRALGQFGRSRFVDEVVFLNGSPGQNVFQLATGNQGAWIPASTSSRDWSVMTTAPLAWAPDE